MVQHLIFDQARLKGRMYEGGEETILLEKGKSECGSRIERDEVCSCKVVGKGKEGVGQ